MFKKLFKYFAFLIVIIIFSTTIAFSYWRVDFKSSSASDISLGQDDIAENYSFIEGSRKFTTKNYTLYLFPSTIYLQMYLDYLDGKMNQKPEDLYGHISPMLKEDGAIDYDENGAVQYTSNSIDGDETYLQDWVKKGGTYESTYLYSDESKRTAYYQTVYTNSNWLNVTNADSYLYGDPVYDQVQVSYKTFTDSDEQHNYRNLHQYDRFGFWPKVSKDSGRYLPLRIEVDENFSSSFYETVVERPLADMGDPHGWYCYSFTLWSYVAIQKDEEGKRIGYQAPYYASNSFMKNLSTANQSFYGKNSIVNPALSAFCPTSVSQYFDLMGDFSMYADEEGIIRLFPKFSNGKTYSENSTATDKTGNTTLPCGFLNGGSDAIRMTPSFKNANAFNQHDFYFSYLTNLVTYNRVNNVGVAILTNVMLNDFNAIDFQVDSTVGYANWRGAWDTIFSIKESQIEEAISTYGEGFYNIYLFLGDVGSSGTSSEKSSFENLINTIKASEGKNGIFPALSGKNLFEISKTSITSNKSVCLSFEKVRDARIVMNIDRGETTEQAIRTKYEVTNQYFRYLSEDVYSTTAGLNVIENINVTTPINEKYQYCYILNDVDFTNANTPNFQIRFQKRYREDLKFCGTSGITGSDPAPDVDLIYNPEIKNTTGTFTKEQRFVNAFQYYFDAQTKSINNTEENKVEQQIIFSLKNEEYKGIYNLIMIYIPNTYYTATIDGKTQIYTSNSGLPKDYTTHAAGFYMFAYRQTNVFLKILANDPKEYYQVPSDNENFNLNEFIIHSGSLSKNMLLFQKEYALGASVRAGDINEGTPNYSNEYLDYTQPVKDYLLATCINTYVKEWMEKDTNAPKSVKRIVIRDHVTKAIVGYYKKVSPTAQDLAEHKEDSYYIEEDGSYYCMAFDQFSIRKNYIFYITKI